VRFNKTIAGVLLFLLALSTTVPTAAATKVVIKVGAACPSIGKSSVAGNVAVICTNLGKKLIWTIQRSLPAPKTFQLNYGTDIHGLIVGAANQSVVTGLSGTAVTAEPMAGYEFVAWSDGKTVSTRIDTPAADTTLIASFKQIIYTITYSADAHGSLLGDLTQTIVAGAQTSPVSVKADTGYEFDGWSDGKIDITRADFATATKNFIAHFKEKSKAPIINGHSIGSLLWSDEFDATTKSAIDSKSWTARNCGSATSNGGSTCMTGEVQYYAPSAVSVDGTGDLVITATHTTNPPQDAGACGAWNGSSCPFVSARLDTQSKVSFQYGYIEAKIKMPKGAGNWPAFWLLGTNITSVGWPSSGEIDIVEAGGDKPALVHGSLNYKNGAGSPAYVTAINNSRTDLSDDFHTYGLLWLKDSISFYFDGQLYETQTPSSISGPNWSFNAPFFLILNNAIAPTGSYYGGSWDGWESSTMTVDFVRAWQIDGQGTVTHS